MGRRKEEAGCGGVSEQVGFGVEQTGRKGAVRRGLSEKGRPVC